MSQTLSVATIGSLGGNDPPSDGKYFKTTSEVRSATLIPVQKLYEAIACDPRYFNLRTSLIESFGVWNYAECIASEPR